MSKCKRDKFRGDTGKYLCELYFPDKEKHVRRGIWLFKNDPIPEHVLSINPKPIILLKESMTGSGGLEAYEGLLHHLYKLAIEDACVDVLNKYITEAQAYQKEQARLFLGYYKGERIATICNMYADRMRAEDTSRLKRLFKLISPEAIAYFKERNFDTYLEIKKAYKPNPAKKDYILPEYCDEVRKAIKIIAMEDNRENARINMNLRNERMDYNYE